MSIKDAIKKYNNIEIELLLAHVLRKKKEFVFMNPGKSLSASQLISLSAMAKRRLKGEPLAYILGFKDFMGLRFKVNKNVLIPRPETEILVEKVAQCVIARRNASDDEAILSQGNRLLRSSAALGTRNDTLKILDVGTGSGCIIISLAKTLSQMLNVPPSPRLWRAGKCQMFATDISKKALAVARQNARRHKVKVKFVQSDLLSKIKTPMDIIVANLPYGWKEWKNNTSADTIGLKFEPQNALFAKENGLYLIRRLLEQIAKLKNKPQRVFLEFDPRQKPDLHRIIKIILPYSTVEFFKDYAGHWRMAEIVFPAIRLPAF